MGAGTTGPIFVGGDHRSGTTLVSLVLDSHPQLTVGPEIDFLEPINLGSHVLECCDLIESEDERVAGQGVQTNDPAYGLGVQFVRQCHRFGVDLADLRHTVARTVETTGSDLVSFRARCALMNELGELRRTTTGSLRWGIKIQRSIGRASAFGAVWPSSQFVHVLRDGRDVAASQLRGSRGWGYESVEEAACGWLEIVESRSLRRLGIRSHTLRYEDLVAEPATAARSLLRFLGLRWSEAVLRHDEAEHSLLRNPYEHPSAETVSRPIYADAVGRYRRDLSPSELAAFERIARAALTRLGYSVAPSGGRD